MEEQSAVRERNPSQQAKTRTSERREFLAPGGRAGSPKFLIFTFQVTMGFIAASFLRKNDVRPTTLRQIIVQEQTFCCMHLQPTLGGRNWYMTMDEEIEAGKAALVV